MTPLNAAYAMIASWVAGAFAIEAHYFLRMLIHRRCTELANLSHDSERTQAQGADTQQSNYQKIRHDFSFKRSVSESLRGDVAAVVSPSASNDAAAVTTEIPEAGPCGFFDFPKSTTTLRVIASNRSPDSSNSSAA